MSKQIVQTGEAAPPGGPYSQATVGGGLIFLAGQTPWTAAGEKVEGSFAEQAEQTFDNLEAVIRAAGGTIDGVLRVGVYLRDMANFAEMNRIYVERFGEERLPARTTIQAALPGFEIEIDAVVLAS